MTRLKSQEMSDTIELPITFTHEAPDGYRYEVFRKKANVLSIWTVHCRGFNYNGHDPTYCIWGFYDIKRGIYYSPINHKQLGNAIDIKDTSPYTAMPKPKVKINLLDFLL